MRQMVERFDARARVLLCRPTGPGDGKMLRVVEVAGEPSQMDAILRLARRSSSRGSIAIDQRAPHRALIWSIEPTPAACAAVFHVGAVCTTCPLFPRSNGGKDEEEEEWSLLLPRMSPRAKALLKVFGPHDGSSALLRVGGIAPEAEMTSRQERAVETAFRMGYFDHPRRSGLREVAAELGVSRSTTLELLRRGLTKVLSRRETTGVPGFVGQ
ncbi:MAG: helix-turn-helix domain-containing protein [Euryarchaeota archaeon]|nr:helix-turn-helix domain-containing protein [Euryarchaeota archaeon]MDE1835382.1 helix-turn-helix domain-containing protein [Euryarchaeota archaeon]MDE1880485.1 helix-turn-helix domain-containing protein [Euryarchaeota archaeon]MDE2043678.1 helix-turn-helix domain-containing protein [Thermoplasmata archaeon]